MFIIIALKNKGFDPIHVTCLKNRKTKNPITLFDDLTHNPTSTSIKLKIWTTCALKLSRLIAQGDYVTDANHMVIPL